MYLYSTDNGILSLNNWYMQNTIATSICNYYTHIVINNWT